MNTGQAARPRKTPDGLYFKRFTPPRNAAGSQKRIYVQCPADRNTITFLNEMIRAALDRHMSGKFTTDDTFKSYVEEKFLKEYPAAKGLVESSRTLLVYLLGIAMPTLGPKPLGSIDVKTVARFSEELREKMRTVKKTGEVRRAYSDQTIRLTLVAVSSVLRWAAKTEHLATRPEITIPKVADAKKPMPYTREEAQKFIAAARDDEEHALFMLLFDAGLRKSEALGLNPHEQINFEAHVLNCDRQRYRGVDRSTKGKDAREIPMSAELESAIRKVRRPGVKYLFADADGKPRTEDWVRNVFKQARKKTGVRHARVHDSRHTWATQLTADGVDPFALQRLIGHKDIRTTMGYVHTAAQQPRSILASG